MKDADVPETLNDNDIRPLDPAHQLAIVGGDLGPAETVGFVYALGFAAAITGMPLLLALAVGLAIGMAGRPFVKA